MTYDLSETTRCVLEGVQRKIFGLDGVIKLCLVACFTDGHVLLEGNPGMGKTELVKQLAEKLQVKWGRIQFTPDLMPSDITGTYMYLPSANDPSVREWKPQRGRIFTSLLLADEINRATPKTQSAMLEAMAERQVTMPGGEESEPLPKPFMVLATQNPIDQEGTYNLPEAQADRFMFKVLVPPPGKDVLLGIIAKKAGKAHNVPKQYLGNADGSEPSDDQIPDRLSDQQAGNRHKTFLTAIREEELLPAAQEHIRNLYLVSQNMIDDMIDVSAEQRRQAAELAKIIHFGLSPRAAIALTLGVKAWSLMFMDAIGTGDGASQARALAHVSLSAIRHRIKPHFDWEEHYWKMCYRGKPAPVDGYPPGFWDAFLVDLCKACAPTTSKSEYAIYNKVYTSELDALVRHTK